MKKILTLCAALVAAMSMSAEVKNMTCAEPLLLQHCYKTRNKVRIPLP